MLYYFLVQWNCVVCSAFICTLFFREQFHFLFIWQKTNFFNKIVKARFEISSVLFIVIQDLPIKQKSNKIKCNFNAQWETNYSFIIWFIHMKNDSQICDSIFRLFLIHCQIRMFKTLFMKISQSNKVSNYHCNKSFIY